MCKVFEIRKKKTHSSLCPKWKWALKYLYVVWLEQLCGAGFLLCLLISLTVLLQLLKTFSFQINSTVMSRDDTLLFHIYFWDETADQKIASKKKKTQQNIKKEENITHTGRAKRHGGGWRRYKIRCWKNIKHFYELYPTKKHIYFFTYYCWPVSK